MSDNEEKNSAAASEAEEEKTAEAETKKNDGGAKNDEAEKNDIDADAEQKDASPAAEDRIPTLRRFWRRALDILLHPLPWRDKSGKENKKRTKLGKIRCFFNWFFGILFALLILLLVFRDFIIHHSIEIIGSWLTGVEITVAEFSTDLIKGQLRIIDFTIANPAGFKGERMMHLDNCFVDIDPETLLSKNIHIEDIVVENLRFQGEYNSDGLLNVAVLNDNLAKHLPPPENDTPPPEPTGLVITIDHIGFSGHFQITDDSTHLTIPLPLALQLRDLSIEDDGESIADYIRDYSKNFVEFCGSLRLGQIGTKIIKSTSEGGKKILENTAESGKKVLEKINIFK